MLEFTANQIRSSEFKYLSPLVRILKIMCVGGCDSPLAI